MTPKKKAKAPKPKKPDVLKDPKVKKGLATLKKTEGAWDDKDLKSEIGKIKKQQGRLNKLLMSLKKIEFGGKKKPKKK